MIINSQRYRDSRAAPASAQKRLQTRTKGVTGKSRYAGSGGWQ